MSSNSNSNVVKAQHWPCGTPKSTENYFNWRAPAKEVCATQAEKDEATRTYNREYARRRYAKLKALRDAVNAPRPSQDVLAHASKPVTTASSRFATA